MQNSALNVITAHPLELWNEKKKHIKIPCVFYGTRILINYYGNIQFYNH